MKIMKKTMLGFGLALLFVTAAATRSEAAIIALDDNNSHVDIDNASSAGMFNWEVDGVNQLFQQWFWYRIGAGGPEQSIEALGNPLFNTTNSDFEPGDEQASLQYSDASLQVNVQYTLAGGAVLSGQSHITESIQVKNLSNAALDLHFFQYSDFDLNGSPNDSVEVAPEHSVRIRWSSEIRPSLARSFPKRSSPECHSLRSQYVCKHTQLSDRRRAHHAERQCGPRNRGRDVGVSVGR